MKRSASHRSGSGRMRWWLASVLSLGLWSTHTTGCDTLVGLDDLDKRDGQPEDDGTGGSASTLNTVGAGGGPVVDTVTNGVGGGAQIAVCGDGVVQRGEECDDGGTDSGDGCSEHCEVECPGGFVSPQLHCYQLFIENVNWLTALDNCYALGPGYDLAAVSSAAERNFIDDVVDVVGPVWIGGTDVEQEGLFVWSNGEPFAFDGWAAGEPDNNGDQDCIEYNSQLGDSNDVFNDELCSATQPYLCELTPAGGVAP